MGHAQILSVRSSGDEGVVLRCCAIKRPNGTGDGHRRAKSTTWATHFDDQINHLQPAQSTVASVVVPYAVATYGRGAVGVSEPAQPAPAPAPEADD